MALLAAVLAGTWSGARAAELDEYQLKAAYVQNFATFTIWPAEIGNTLTLCIYGPDPFGAAVDALEGANINGRSFRVRRINTVDQIRGCAIVYVATETIENLPRVIDETQGEPVLIIADTPAAALGGAGINMVLEEGKIGFEINLVSLRENGLDISFQLLRLARKVYQ